MANIALEGIKQVGMRIPWGQVGRWAMRKLTGEAAKEVGKQAAQEATREADKKEPCEDCEPEECKKLREEMKRIVERRKGIDDPMQRGLRERAEDMIEPKKDLGQLERPGGGRGRKLGGHATAWGETQNQLIKKLNEWKDKKCGPPPDGMMDWATAPPPGKGGTMPGGE